MIDGSGTGFVLRTWPLRESDLIASILTQEDGRIRGVAHRATRPKSRWGGALEPLTEIHVHWRTRDGQDLGTLTDVSIVRSPYQGDANLGVTWTLAFLAELIETSTAPHDADETLYRLLGSSVDALLGGQDVFVVAR